MVHLHQGATAATLEVDLLHPATITMITIVAKAESTHLHAALLIVDTNHQEDADTTRDLDLPLCGTIEILGLLLAAVTDIDSFNFSTSPFREPNLINKLNKEWHYFEWLF